MENVKIGGHFWNRFEVAIDKKNMSEVDKFNYLLGLLQEDVKNCVRGLELSAENYIQAKEILEERFGNKQLSVNAHMKALVKLPNVESLNDGEQ